MYPNSMNSICTVNHCCSDKFINRFKYLGILNGPIQTVGVQCFGIRK